MAILTLVMVCASVFSIKKERTTTGEVTAPLTSSYAQPPAMESLELGETRLESRILADRLLQQRQKYRQADDRSSPKIYWDRDPLVCQIAGN